MKIIKNIEEISKFKLNIQYENIFQMLKRGIGLYITNTNEYKWLIHKLLINKDIGIVISDKYCV